MNASLDTVGPIRITNTLCSPPIVGNHSIGRCGSCDGQECVPVAQLIDSWDHVDPLLASVIDLLTRQRQWSDLVWWPLGQSHTQTVTWAGWSVGKEVRVQWAMYVWVSYCRVYWILILGLRLTPVKDLCGHCSKFIRLCLFLSVFKFGDLFSFGACCSDM